MWSISKGRLEGVRFVAANSSGDAIKPSLIVLHDTAGRLDKFNSVDWFASKACKTSAHFVVERDGTVTQMVRTDRKAFHAGESSFKGRRFCNGYAIGIEIVSPGKMDASGKAWFGHACEPPLIQRTTPEHGSGWWLAYTPEQVAAVQTLCRSLVEAYPAIADITTHWQISPGRKIDPCPLFPVAAVAAFAFADPETGAVVEPLPGPQTAPQIAPVAADPVPVEVTPPAPVPAAVRAPVAFPGVGAAMAWTTTVERDLGPVSRKVGAIARARKFLHALWAAVVAMFTLENLGVAKTWIDAIKELAGDNVGLLIVTGSIAGLALLTYVLSLIGDDHAEGHYVPSGVRQVATPPAA